MVIGYFIEVKKDHTVAPKPGHLTLFEPATAYIGIVTDVVHHFLSALPYMHLSKWPTSQNSSVRPDQLQNLIGLFPTLSGINFMKHESKTGQGSGVPFKVASECIRFNNLI